MSKNRVFKKILVGAMALMMTLSSLPIQPLSAYAEEAKAATTAAEQPSAWAIEEVGFSYVYQIVADEDLGQFKQDLTREDMLKVLVKLYEVKSKKEIAIDKAITFKDTSSDVFKKAEKIGLIKVGADRLANPTQKVEREELMQMMYNLAKMIAPESKAKTMEGIKFLDQDKVTAELKELVEYLVSNGVVNGRKITSGENKGAQLLDLEGHSQKQEFFVMAKRLYDLVSYENKEYSKGFLYKVSDENSTVYMLGSIHIGDARLFPMSKAIVNGFNSSEYLGVEANIMGDQEGVQYMLSKMVYTDGTSLKDHVSKDLYDATIKAFAKVNMTEEMVKNYKPWAVYLVLPQLEAMTAENTSKTSAVAGVDMYLMSKAVASQKPIIELEGMKFQVDLLDGFSDKIQTALLEGTVKGMELSEKENKNLSSESIDKMLNAWRDGDVKTMSELAATMDGSTAASPEMKEFNTAFLNKRNDHMVEKVKEYLADDEDYFVVVGALHVVGENGMVKALEKQGFKVEKITE